MESFQTVWKVSGQSENLPDGPESFQTDWKVSSWSGKFPDSLKIFLIVWKVSGQYGKFPDSVDSFQFPIYILHFCKNSFGTFACCMLQKALIKGFMHFWRIYVARPIYALLAHMCRIYVAKAIYGLRLEKFCV